MNKKYSSTIIDHQFNKVEQTITIHYNKKAPKISPIVIFIPGSAWLGHIKLIYYVSNFWNKYLPINLAKNGHSCITLRHRGAFFKNWEILNIFNIITISIFFFVCPPISIFYIITLLILHNLRIDAPSYDNILSDLLDSLNYIDNNYFDLQKKLSGNNEVILVGYSSGSQLLLELLKTHSLLNFKNIFVKDIVLISGVYNFDNNIYNFDNKKFNIIKNILYLYHKCLFNKNLESPINYVNDLPVKNYTIIGSLNEFENIKYLKDLSKFVFCHDKFFDRLSSTKSIYYMNKNHWSILRCKKVLKILLKLLEN